MSESLPILNNIKWRLGLQNKGLIISNISNLYMVEDVDTKIIIKCNARGKLKEKMNLL